MSTMVLGACGSPDRGPAIPEHGPTLTSSHGADYMAHEVILRMSPEVSTDMFVAHLQALGATLVDSDSALSQRLGFLRVRLDEQLMADEAISDLLAAHTAETAERHYLAQASVVPDDARFGELWGMKRIGMPEAWDRSVGSREIVVAISDSGIDVTHPDLAANIWTNEGEIPGNGRDDDGNGYVDDVHGYNWNNRSGNPADDNGHGTHVAGTVGAVGNDGRGVVGANWNVRMQALKFLGRTGSGGLWEGAATILYAADMGADVVNASWGCKGCNTTLVRDAIRALNDAGGIFVAAAGNSADNIDTTPHYPAAHVVDNMITVAATGTRDELAYFSNYGRGHTHIAAPGRSILSTLPGNKYASWQGTSMAAPHVAGAAALFLSLHPSASVAQVREAMFATCEPLASVANKVSCGGLLDVPAFLHTDDEAPAAVTGLRAETNSSDVTLSWDANTEPDLASYWVRWGVESGVYNFEQQLPKSQTSFQVQDLQDGQTYYFSLQASDESSNRSEAVEIAVPIRDELAPPPVIDLRAEVVAGVRASGAVVASSGAFSSYYDSDFAYDNDPTTVWLSPARNLSQEEYLIVELGEVATVSRVTLTASEVYPAFFPTDLDLEASLDGNLWKPLTSRRGLQAPTEPAPLDIVFASEQARMIRLRMREGGLHPSGFHYIALAEFAVHQAPEDPTPVSLTFTAPGDDPGAGRAASYDVRASSSMITEDNFADADVVESTAPLTAGVLEELVVEHMAPEQEHFFALTATDDAGNVSPMSNVASVVMPRVPPSTVVDLEVVSVGSNRVTLGWTAPSDNGGLAPVAEYDVRYATAPIDGASFYDASRWQAPTPAEPGSWETLELKPLRPGQAYYFAVRGIDALGVVSGISNVVVAVPNHDNETDDDDDHRPRAVPATVDDLIAMPARALRQLQPTVRAASSQAPDWEATNLLDDDLLTGWSTNSDERNAPAWVELDLGEQVALNEIHMRSVPHAYTQHHYPENVELLVSADGHSWQEVDRAQGLNSDIDRGDVFRIEPVWARYVRLHISRRGIGFCMPDDDSCHRPTVVAEMDFFALTPEEEAELVWVSPGYDGWVGTATAFEMRMSDAPLTDDNFAQGQLVTTPEPEQGGSVQHTRTLPLAAETTFHFRLRAVGANGVWSELSNEATFTTRGVPPAPVVDLAAVGSTPHSVSLQWTASGDDGTLGRASRYDLRYARTPIQPSNWDQATPVTGLPAPRDSGAPEVADVEGLAANTTYYFALRVIDDADAVSLVSNNAIATTGDDVPPDAVQDLVARAATGDAAPALSLAALTADSQYSDQTSVERLADGSPDTLWLSGAHGAGSSETLQAELEQAVRVSRVRMLAAESYTDLFPRAFEVQTRDPETRSWHTAVTVSGMVDVQGWEEVSLGAVEADAVRLVVREMGTWTGAHYAALAELELYAEQADGGAVQLQWTAPTDEGPGSRVVAYDLRTDGDDLDDRTFDGATPVAAPAPGAPATLERQMVADLQPGARHCFALKSEDAAGNVSDLSNSACAVLPNPPPRNVTDLEVSAVGPHHVDLAWSTPEGPAPDHYEVRYAQRPIHQGNWDDAVSAGEFSGRQGARVGDLDSLTTYFFAVRGVALGGAQSGVSNNVSATTLDDVPPTTVSDLVVQTDTSRSGALVIRFTAPGDNGPVGQAALYDVRLSNEPFDASTFQQQQQYQVGDPAPGGSHESFGLTDLSLESPYFVALKARDASGNWSAMSNLADGRTREEAPAAVDDLRLVEATGDSLDNNRISVAWTAPGDNGDEGRADSYELRWSTSLIHGSNWGGATPVDGLPSPANAGTEQGADAAGFAPGTTYFLALRTRDARGNLSPLSNVLEVTTPDDVAPGKVLDLRAETGSGHGQLVVRWTATGDDGDRGRAQSYDLRWSESALDEDNFLSGTPIATGAAGDAGTRESVVAAGLPDERPIHVAIRLIDDAGNVGAVSDSASARTRDRAPERVTDLALVEAESHALVVTFTAPGDDGDVGTADRYEMRVHDAPMDTASFEAATAVPTPDPAEAGTREQVRVEGLEENRAYYVAVRAVDERGNRGAISNQLLGNTVDSEAPAQVDDLTAETGPSQGSIRLRWTAPGDDGDVGTADHYLVRYATSAIDAASWQSATPVAGVASPKAAGSAETLLVEDLQGERTYHFAMRAVDDAGNEGALSASVSADTPPVPPAKIGDLRAEVSPGTITLRWTAVGDDGLVGTATSYDLRKDTALLTASSFLSAPRMAGLPAPAAPGTEQVHVLSGLPESTTYWLAIKAEDDAGGVGEMSNVVMVTTPDLTAPSAPLDLVVTSPGDDDDPFGPSSAQASSQLDSQWGADQAVDRSPSSAWSSEGGALPSEQTLTADLGAVQYIDRIRALPDADYPELFPAGMTFAISSNGSDWSDVLVESAFAAPDSDSWVTWGFSPREARYVRMTTTDMRSSFDRYYAIVAELDVLRARLEEGQADLFWLAPGDDGAVGTASSYEIFYADAPFDANSLGSATRVVGPAPAPAGSLQAWSVGGLQGEHQYYWAVRAVDDGGNAGALSAVVAAKTNPVAPGVVSDLDGEATGMTTASLSFTATGDDADRGQATRYELRYAPWQLTSANFPLATKVPMGAPKASGELETADVTDLEPGTTYRFAVVAYDEDDNASYLSNVLVLTTSPAPDVTAPGTIHDLSVRLPAPGGVPFAADLDRTTSELLPDFAADNLTDGAYATVWSTAPQVDNSVQRVRLRLDEMQDRAELRLWPAGGLEELFPSDFELRVSPDGLNWQTVLDVDGYTGADSGTPVTVAVVDTDFRYVELWVDGMSAHENGFFYAAASELEVLTLEAPAGSVQITWTAPGDDGFEGTAAEYDLRMGACPYAHSEATPLTTWSPRRAGTPERMLFEGVAPGTYCVGITATDDEGQVSELSNVETVTIAE